MTPKQLSIVLQRPIVVCNQWLPFLEESMSLADITTDIRKAYFLAQIGHESGSLRWTSEIWGPTPQQLRYECDPRYPWRKTGVNSLALTLGNVHKGDGYLFRGRGLIQTTGRFNYTVESKRLSELLNSPQYAPDTILRNPTLLATPRLACLSAASFWIRKNLNVYSDRRDIRTQTKLINGGYNGLSDRMLRFNRYLLTL